MISEPLASAASTTSTPRASPLIRRLRRGKLAASGGVPSGNSDTSAPRAAIGLIQSRVPLRIDDVDAAAEHRDRRSGAAQRAAVRGGVDAERKAARDRQAGVAERAREALGVGRSLRGGVAAADDCEPAAREQRGIAEHVEQRGRIGDLEQLLRVRGIGQGDDRAVGRLDPTERGVDRGGAVVGQDPLGERVADAARERCAPCGQHL